MNIKDLFNNIIANNLRSFVFEYNVNSKEFFSRGYHHSLDENIDNKIINSLIDYIVFYSFDPDEVESEYQKGRLDNMRKAAVAAYRKRVPKTERETDGLLSELTLGALLKTFFPEVDFTYARVKYIEQVPTKSHRQEAKGYDDISFSVEDGAPVIWIGQAKAGDKSYCYSSIKGDLNKNLLKDYFADSMMIVADIMRAKNDSNLIKVIDAINDLQFENANRNDLYDKVIEYFKTNHIKVKMPCLLMYDYAYPDDDFSAWKIKVEQDIISKMKDFNLNNTEGLDASVIFMVFCVRDLENLRKLLYDFRIGECHETD